MYVFSINKLVVFLANCIRFLQFFQASIIAGDFIEDSTLPGLKSLRKIHLPCENV